MTSQETPTVPARSEPRQSGHAAGATLPSPTLAGGTLPYVARDDPFFDQLVAWGDTIWELWLNDLDVPGAAPIEMTSASWGP